MTLTMLCWLQGALEDDWLRGAPCLELLKTSDWDREGGWGGSMGAFSVSEEEEGGVFPRSTARSILQETQKPETSIRNDSS